MKLFKGKDLAAAIGATLEDIAATEKEIADLQKDRQARLLDLGTDELARTDLLIDLCQLVSAEIEQPRLSIGLQASNCLLGCGNVFQCRPDRGG